MTALRHQAIALAGVVERNTYLVKRYGWWELAFFVWTVANTLTIVFIAKGVETAGGEVDVNRLTAVLLLLDEPTTGLDPRAKLEVQGFIREVRRLQDTTTLLCTHDMVEAETLADRVGILDHGRLLALETPTALRRRYRADTLEDAFMAATGKTFADEPEEEAA